MRRALHFLFVIVCTVGAPAAAWAQASLAGTVKDPSGAVLPGVTVEATSPALIEKVRAAVTDGTGQYRIEDLRPGTYAVTFALPGFNTLKRAGIVLSGGQIANVSVELRVGALEETVTVTGEAPVVDVRSTRREMTLNNDTIRSIPSVRSYSALLMTVPGVQTDRNNVATGPLIAIAPIHGGRSLESRLYLDGLNVGNPHGGNQPPHYVAEIGNASEVTFSTSGGLGESETAGLVMNVVPKYGGNTISGMAYFSGFSQGMQSNNWTPDLGIAAPVPNKKVYDVTGSVGGPIARDRVWYFVGGTSKGSTKDTANLFFNKNAGLADAWTYVPDLERPAYSDRTWEGINARITVQANPRNKLSVFWDEQAICRKCTGATFESGSAVPTTSPEAEGVAAFMPQRVQQATWSSPWNNRVLFDAAVGTSIYQSGNAERRNSQTRDLIRVTESAGTVMVPDNPATPAVDPIVVNNLTYRSQNWSHNDGAAITWRAATSFVTGAHSVKVGYQGNWWKSDITSYVNTQGLSYTLRDGVPTSFTMTVSPFEVENRASSTALFAQEQWTLGRLTLQGAVRYDRAWSYFPEQQVGPDRFLPIAIVFPAQKGIAAYNDITPRVGVAWDVFGTGKTALKVNLGKYLEGASSSGSYSAPNPMTRLAGGRSATRSWIDADRDFVVDCDPLNPAAQSAATTGSADTCGITPNAAFGTNRLTTTYDPDLLGGWGVRPSDWSLGVSVQQQLLPRASLEVAYHRRWFSGFTVTDNRALGPDDFDRFSVTAPADARLPGGGGFVVDNLYNPRLNPTPDNFVTSSRKIGDEYRKFNGVDVTLNVRAAQGITFQGGTSTGETVTDNCEIRQALPETSPLNPFCHRESGYLTQFRGLAAYTIPRIDVLVSTVYLDKPGQPGIDASLNANWVVPQTAYISSLGRVCTGCVPGGPLPGTFSLLEPGTLYGDRIRELDLGIKKVLGFGGTRTTVGLDIYNVLNSNVTLTYNNTFVPGGAWLTPTEIMTARIFRVTGEFTW
jgi:hypothetical protein